MQDFLTNDEKSVVSVIGSLKEIVTIVTGVTVDEIKKGLES